MRYFIFVLLFISSYSVSCESINFGYLSYHYENYDFEGKPYNEVNYGFGCNNILESDFDFIHFKNSHSDIATAISKFILVSNFYESDYLLVKAGVQVGLVHGYRLYSDPIMPLILPKMNVTLKNKDLYLSFVLLYTSGIAMSVNFNL